LIKASTKSRPSVRQSPLLRPFETCVFRLLLRRQFNRNQLLHQPTLRRVLLSSQSDKIPKVELLIAIKDQTRVPHERKTDVLVKSKPKSRPSVRRAPLLCLQLKPVLFRSLQRRQLIATNCCTSRLCGTCYYQAKATNSKGPAADYN